MSKLFTISTKDLFHSLIWAVIFAVIAVVEDSMKAGGFDITTKTVLYAVIGAVINVLKRFATNSQGDIKKEPQ